MAGRDGGDGDGGGYELRVTPGRGEGLFATKAFKRGDLVIKGWVLEELPGNDSHASQVSKDRWIRHGGLLPKANHSCSPVMGIRVNAEGAHDFVAFADIEEGTELVFDYAMRNYTVDHFPGSCLCGASSCRGSISGWKDLPADAKEKYKGFVADYLLELDQEAAK